MTNQLGAQDVRLATESQRQAVVIDDHLVGEVASTLERAGVRFQDVVDEARLADKVQHVDLGLVKALRLHWKAALWSAGISTCLVMEGYDLVIITSLYVVSFCRPPSINKLITFTLTFHQLRPKRFHRTVRHPRSRQHNAKGDYCTMAERPFEFCFVR